MNIQIVIDRDKCMGSGNCVFWAPGAFDLDDDGYSVVRQPVDADEQQLRQACEGCPTGAISLWRDGAGVPQP